MISSLDLRDSLLCTYVCLSRSVTNYNLNQKLDLIIYTPISLIFHIIRIDQYIQPVDNIILYEGHSTENYKIESTNYRKKNSLYF